MADVTGDQTPQDPMDTDGEEDETERESDDLLKEAEDLLNSPSARKAPQTIDVNAGADSDSATGTASDTGTDGKKNGSEKTVKCVRHK
jgi:hypothetical protein